MQRSLKLALPRLGSRALVAVVWSWGFLASGAPGLGAEISGYVYDTSAGVVAGARVSILRQADGLTRSTTSDSQGFFSFPNLSPGHFSLQVSRADFEPASIQDLTLSVDQAIRLEISLRPRGPHETVTVQVRSWELGGLGGLVTSQVIEELPLNGRDVVQLAALTATVVPSRGRARNINTGYGVPFSIAGARPTQNAIYLDGINIADHTGATPAGVTGILQGLDTLQEFSVLTTTRGASLGRAAGGVINAVTRSGSNEFHGSGFYSLRDGHLDARNFFQPSRDTDYSRHQGGLQLGFPLQPDVLFGFLAVEWLRENDNAVAIDTTLSDRAREGDLLSGPVTVDPEVAAVLEAYPRANGPILGDTALFQFNNPQRTRQLSFSGRLDSLRMKDQQWSLRYSFDDAHRRDRSTFDLLDRRSESRHQSLVLNGLWEPAPQLVHSTRFGFNRSLAWDGRTDGTGAVINDTGLAFLPGRHGPGIIDVPGLSAFPGARGALDSDRRRSLRCSSTRTSLGFEGGTPWPSGEAWSAPTSTSIQPVCH